MNKFEIDKNDETIIYRGIKLDITITQLSDYRLITGLDLQGVLEYLYNEKLEKIKETRNLKIDKIIKPQKIIRTK